MQQLPKTVSYKEIMIVYGFDVARAKQKLWQIRGILGKKRFQNVLVQEFCQVENLSADIFNNSLADSYNAFSSKKPTQMQLSF